MVAQTNANLAARSGKARPELLALAAAITSRIAEDSLLADCKAAQALSLLVPSEYGTGAAGKTPTTISASAASLAVPFGVMSAGTTRI